MEIVSPEYVGIAAAAERVGVTVSTLKRWADEGRLPCLKTRGGHRRFLGTDVERLLAEMSARSGHALSRAEEWLALCLQTDVHQLIAGLYAGRARLGTWYRVAEEMGEGLRLLGAQWAQGRLGILDEHLASERLHRALSHIAAGISLAPEAPSCLLATPPGEEHTLGLSMVELCLREVGWQSLWGGSAVPAEEMSRRLSALPVSMVAASASASSAAPRRLARWAVEVGRACAQKGIPFVAGGAGDWPAEIDGGVRLRTFAQLHALVAGLGPSQ